MMVFDRFVHTGESDRSFNKRTSQIRVEHGPFGQVINTTSGCRIQS
jgi:hypothetical protein